MWLTVWLVWLTCLFRRPVLDAPPKPHVTWHAPAVTGKKLHVTVNQAYTIFLHPNSHNYEQVRIIAMARLSNASPISSSSVPSFDQSSAELGFLLARLQKSVLHPDPARERRLRTDEYERVKLASVRLKSSIIPYND